jgi:hypothetical protein
MLERRKEDEEKSMQSKAIADPKPVAPQPEPAARARGIDALPIKLVALAATIAACWWITRQPAQVSAEILRAVLLMAIGVMGAKLTSELVADVRGKEAMEVLATLGRWTATVFASLVCLLLIAVVLMFVSYWTGLSMLDLLRLAGLNV